MNDSVMHYDLIVIGAGAMGLAAAYQGVSQGRSVLVLEADEIPGGMAAHFNIGDLSIERYYHFICKTDYDTFELLEELGIADRLKWRATKMGYYYHGKNYEWGNPLALLKFPKLNLIEKFRYGLLAFWCTKRKSWDKVEPLTAPEWLIAWLGKSGYKKMWERLFWLKFYEHTDQISASWIGTRIRRVGLSRKSMFEETLGYLEGGTDTLVESLLKAIEGGRGVIQCGETVQNIAEKTDRSGCIVTSVKGQYQASRVISTVPTPFISRIVPSLSEDLKAQYDSIPNIGVACLIFELTKSVTKNFWHNIIDDELNIPGIIEFSNLRRLDTHIVYVPYYMPTTQERWGWSDDKLIGESLETIQAVNPDISKDDVLNAQVSRLKFAQPICFPNFLETLPPVQTPIESLQIADTCYYYPEDRGLSESIKIGRKMARKVT